MSLTPAVLYTGGQLTTSAVTLYTVPANTKAVVTKMMSMAQPKHPSPIDRA